MTLPSTTGTRHVRRMERLSEVSAQLVPTSIMVESRSVFQNTKDKEAKSKEEFINKQTQVLEKK